MAVNDGGGVDCPPSLPAEQHYSLKWNDYSVKLVTAFQSLRDEDDFVDVTVACDGRQYSAHKMVLSACSPYFRTVLRANPCQHPVVILKDVGHHEVERLLEFMYNGEVNIAQDQLSAFLKTAENLKIRGLAGSSDDMEQTCHREFGHSISSSGKSQNQQHLSSNNGKDDSEVISLGSHCGSSPVECFSPVHKKRRLILDGSDRGRTAEDDSRLNGGSNDGGVGAMMAQAGSFASINVQCLARDLKAEPCDVTEPCQAGTMSDVYTGDGDHSQDQMMTSTPHLYTIGVGGSTNGGVDGGQQDLNSAGQHSNSDQGGALMGGGGDGDVVGTDDTGMAQSSFVLEGVMGGDMSTIAATSNNNTINGNIHGINRLRKGGVMGGAVVNSSLELVDSVSRLNCTPGVGLAERELFGLFQKAEASQLPQGVSAPHLQSVRQLLFSEPSSLRGRVPRGGVSDGIFGLHQPCLEEYHQDLDSTPGSDQQHQQWLSEGATNHLPYHSRSQQHHAPYCSCSLCRGCSFCGKLFSTMGSRKRHERDKHVQTQALVCRVCGKWCKNKGALIKHKSLLHRDVAAGDKAVLYGSGVDVRTAKPIVSNTRTAADTSNKSLTFSSSDCVAGGGSGNNDGGGSDINNHGGGSDINIDGGVIGNASADGGVVPFIAMFDESDGEVDTIGVMPLVSPTILGDSE